MAVFLYHGFVKGIPQELEEAAEMDGCGQFQVFWYMVFPLLKPITATVCITNVLWAVERLSPAAHSHIRQ